MIKKVFYRLKCILFLIAYKKIHLDEILRFKVTDNQIEYFALSSNVITIIKDINKNMFFRQCNLHSDFKTLLDTHLTLFYKIAIRGQGIVNFSQYVPIRIKFSENEVKMFREYINKCASNTCFYKRIRNIGYCMKKDHFDLWEGRISLSAESMHYLGFDVVEEGYEDLFANFLIYFRGVINSYNMHFLLNRNDVECFWACRSIASYQIAKLIGLERLITKTEMAAINVDDNFRYGVLSEIAQGFRAKDAKKPIHPSLQRELSNLSLLDMICFQIDHGPNNYNIIEDENGFQTVCAFDNDCEWTFLPYWGNRFHPIGIPYNLINEKGEFNIPYLDIVTIESIMNLDFNIVNITLSPYLNKLQLYSLKKRINKLQKAISSVGAQRRCFLKQNEWNINTVNEELSGKYGDTYLIQYNNMLKQTS